MAIVPLTLTISLCLVFTFVIFFLREHARGRLSSAERDSLLPLAEETPRELNFCRTGAPDPAPPGGGQPDLMQRPATDDIYF